MSLTDFKVKMNKSKINKYKINNNNKTNTKHEFNERYNMKDINKILAKTHFKCQKKRGKKVKKPTFLR